MKRLGLDIKTAFLKSKLQEEIYMEPTEGYKNDKGYVWLMLRALYGLELASKAWNDNLSAFLFRVGFMQGKADTSMLVKRDDNELMIFLVYVDDILAFATCDDELLAFKTAVKT